jgi:hypothetical protein
MVDIIDLTGKLRNELISNILASLIGQDGRLISRWRCLHLDAMSKYSKWWNDTLSHPTPNLIALNIANLCFENPILPSAPSLKRFEIDYCILRLGGYLPNLKVLKVVGSTEVFDLDTNISSQGLTTLELYNSNEAIRLPSVLPALENIVISGYINFGTLQPLSLPQLLSLSYYPRSSEYVQLMQWLGDDLQQLEFLGLSFRPYRIRSDAILSRAMELKQVVQAAGSVKHFCALGLGTLRFLLICFEEGIHLETRLRGCKVKLERDTFSEVQVPTTTFNFRAETIATDIKRIRTLINVPTDETFDSFLSNSSDPDTIFIT